MQIRLASSLQPDSIIDGEGIRTVLWTQGCIHNCLGCHNPETHSFQDGFLVDIAELKKDIDNLKDQDGITFSGGDPMCQPESCYELARYCHQKRLNVWVYTGYTYEQLIELGKTRKKVADFLHEIDVLVDGKFMIEKKSLDIKFRGSTNQRIIDVKKSLLKNKPVQLEQYKFDIRDNKKKKPCVFI